jgi:ABC-type dipeptide/oligopeptide/nickel transport system permease component
MTLYLIRRLLQSIVFLLLASLLIYTTLVIFIPEPATPARRYEALKRGLQERPIGAVPIGAAPAPSDNPLADLEKKYKLDKPWPLNFLVWLFDPSDTEVTGYDLQGNLVTTSKGLDVNILGMRLRGSGILTGDFGKSEGYAPNRQISDVFAARWAETALLLGTSLGLAVLIGLPLGIFGALRQRTATDHMLTFFTLGGLSVPPYVLGLLFIIFLSVLPSAMHNQYGWTWLPWLPAGGFGDRSDLLDRIRHLVLPASRWLSRRSPGCRGTRASQLWMCCGRTTFVPRGRKGWVRCGWCSSTRYATL